MATSPKVRTFCEYGEPASMDLIEGEAGKITFQTTLRINPFRDMRVTREQNGTFCGVTSVMSTADPERFIGDNLSHMEAQLEWLRLFMIYTKRTGVSMKELLRI